MITNATTAIAAAVAATILRLPAVYAADLQPPYSWRGINGQGTFPATNLVTSFHDLAPGMITELKDATGKVTRKLDLPGQPGTRSNIVWRTLLPAWGHSTPVVVGSKVFVTTDQGWKDDAVQLVCVDAIKGDILWKKPVDHLDAWDAERAEKGRKLRAQENANWRKAMQVWNKVFFDETTSAMKTRPMAEYTKLFAWAKGEGLDLERMWGKFNGGQIVTNNGVECWVPGGLVFNKRGPDGENPEVRAVTLACQKERLRYRSGWAADGPWYESTFPSVVSDGKWVYAFAPPDAVVCYDLDGNPRWVTDLENGGQRKQVQKDMASPVLVQGKVIVASYNGANLSALDAATGKVAWRTGVQRDDKKTEWWPEGSPIGFDGHMSPGGTPVVLDLAGTVVVVNANGSVMRVADGRLLGQAHVPKGGPKIKGNKFKYEHVPAPEDLYGGTYTSWVGHGDVVFAQLHEGIYGVRLSVQQDTLKQEILWCGDVGVDYRSANLIYRNGKVICIGPYGIPFVLDAATGISERHDVARAGGYVTNLGLGMGSMFFRTGYHGDGAETRTNPQAMLGHHRATYAMILWPDLNPLGTGVLCPHPPSGPEQDVAERNIANLGTSRVTWSYSGFSCWGNRMYVRGHDYLWCIGDPGKPYISPEDVLQKIKP